MLCDRPSYVKELEDSLQPPEVQLQNTGYKAQTEELVPKHHPCLEKKIDQRAQDVVAYDFL